MRVILSIFVLWVAAVVSFGETVKIERPKDLPAATAWADSDVIVIDRGPAGVQKLELGQIRAQMASGTFAPGLYSGTLNPNGYQTGNPGQYYMLNNGVSIELWVKQTGYGNNTGWVSALKGIGLNEPVNVTWFGAKGDGSTDDTAAFEAALEFLKSSLSQRVYASHFTYPVDVGQFSAKVQLQIPPGVFVISRTLNLFSFLRITGSGRNSSVLQFTSTNSPFLRFCGTDDPFYSDVIQSGKKCGKALDISNLSLRGSFNRFSPHSADSIKNNAIELDGCFHARFEKMKIYGFGGDGLGLYKQEWTHVKDVWIFYNRIGINIDCTKSTVDQSPENNVTSTFEDVTVNNNDQGVVENGTSANLWLHCKFEGNVGEYYHATTDGTYNGPKLEPDPYFLPSINFYAKSCDFTVIRDSYFEAAANDLVVGLARGLHVQDSFFNPTDKIDPASNNGVEWCARHDIIYRDNFFGYNRTGVNANLFGTAYGANTYVAIGFGGAIANSSDGITWSNQTPPTNSTLKAVVFNSSKFVVVGSGGTILTSANGTTWDHQASGSSNTLSGVTYGAGLFVVVGDGGTILTSPDGSTWTARTSGTTETLYAATYGGNQFVAVGMDTSAGTGLVLTSADGVTWTRRTSGVSVGVLNGVAYGGGKYAAVGSGIITSTDGITWAVQSSPLAGYVGVTYASSKFVAVGSAVATSTNGSTWTLQTTGTARSSYGITYGGGQFLTVGQRGLFLTSADGLSWTIRSTSNPAVDEVTLASDGRSHQSSILFETDGSGYGCIFDKLYFSNQTTIKGTNSPERKVIKFTVPNFQYPKFENCNGLVFTNRDTIFDMDPVDVTKPIARIEWAPQAPIDNPRGIAALKYVLPPAMASAPTNLTSLEGIFPATVAYQQGVFEKNSLLGFYALFGNSPTSLIKEIYLPMGIKIGISSGPPTGTNGTVAFNPGDFIFYDGSGGPADYLGWRCTTNGIPGAWETIYIPKTFSGSGDYVRATSPTIDTPTLHGLASVDTGLHFPADGYLAGTGPGRFYLLHENGTSAVGLQFGGVSSSYPQWLNNGTLLQAKLADNSGNAPVSAASLYLFDENSVRWHIKVSTNGTLSTVQE